MPQVQKKLINSFCLRDWRQTWKYGLADFPKNPHTNFLCKLMENKMVTPALLQTMSSLLVAMGQF